MLLIVCCARDAGNNSENGAQSIVDAINRIRHPTSTPAMPAFAFQDRVEHSARTKLRHHCVQSAGMRFFLESAFAQKILYVVLAGEGSVALITKLRFVFFLSRFHPANRDLRSERAIQPSLQAAANQVWQSRGRVGKIAKFPFPTLWLSLFRFRHTQQDSFSLRVLLALG